MDSGDSLTDPLHVFTVILGVELLTTRVLLQRFPTGLPAEQPSGGLGRSGSPTAPRDHSILHQADVSETRQGDARAGVEDI